MAQRSVCPECSHPDTDRAGACCADRGLRIHPDIQFGQHVRHLGYGVTGTVTSWDDRFEVWHIILDAPLPQLGHQSLTELTGTATTLEVIA